MIKSLKNTLLLGLLFLFIAPSVTAQSWDWTRRISGGANDSALSIDVDDEGNVFVAGRCKGFTTFEDETDPIGPITIGDRDVFISKYNKFGQLQWARQAGTAIDGYDLAEGVVADNEGGCYITGYFNDTSTFGSETLISNGFRDVFVSRLGSDGTFLWSKGFGGIGEDNGYGITVDNSGNVIACGRVNGEVAVEGTGIGTAGQFNAYMVQYTPTGTFMEVHYFDGPYKSVGRAVAVDANDNIYFCGGLNGNCSYEGTELETGNSPVWDDAFLLKCNPDYSPVWFQSGGAEYFDTGHSIAISDSAVYLSGTFGGTAVFDTITRSFNSDATGSAAAVNAAKDMFIASYTLDGNIKWLVSAGNEGLDEALSVAVTADDHVYFTGFYTDSASFEDTTIYSFTGTTGIVTSRLDKNGELVWIRNQTNNFSSRSYEVVIDANENLYIAGDYINAMDFDGTVHTSANRDGFGGKMIQSPMPSFTLNKTLFCEGDTIIVTMNGLSSPLTYSYEAMDAYTSWTDSSHIYYIFSESETMTIMGTITASNAFYTDSVILDTTVLKLSDATFELGADTLLCEGMELTIGVPDEYDFYDWSTLEETNEITVTESGTYSLTVVAAGDCEATDEITVLFVDCVGIDELEKSEIELAYNTTNQRLQNLSEITLTNVSITTIDGKVLRTIEKLSPYEAVYLNDFPNGIYLIVSGDGQNFEPVKIIVTK